MAIDRKLASAGASPEMEARQTTQMVTWLDEERRKDKALITRLEERASSQAALVEDQARRIQALEGELAAFRNKMLSMTTFDEAMVRIRAEFASSIEQIQARREAAEQDYKKLRDMDREGMIKAIDELRLESTGRMERELQIRKAEEERLSRVANELQVYATNLTKGLEEFERSLNFLEEQRRQDSRRLSDINGEMIEMTKRTEGQKSKIELLEELARRNERNISQVNNDLGDFKQQRQTWVEQEALAAHQREQVMNDMLRRMDGFAEDMEKFAQQVESWGDTHRNMKKQVDDFDRIADRVDRRLNEVAEMQRLSEERFRHEWEEFMQEDQKRWRQFTLTNEEARREQQHAINELQGQTTRLLEQIKSLTDYIKGLRNIQNETFRNLSSLIQTLREQADDSIGSLPPLS